MTVRFASIAAALVLGLGVPASSAIARSYTAPAGIEWTDRAADAASTRAASRSHVDDSAKMGNAEQNARSVPSYGATSGGPAY
ncbi:hypothetical protein [Methylobacterium haplocladii]|uniref:Hydroxyquinol 1,2-dioxygenase n=2 Tax=Methylobacterium haplocladii TaxID=1176176 RepID=A0A512IJ31_9HYPH|nr:hypothetical protein [Methylobacterium haplocladii]GEO97713.1 hypothetical protein MHA02_01010 [Methylobacterium haplocladii]GJD84030.1 hypothetical protein HPGCJGGD_1905 [Methylobacterium haplocladii]GLS57443.1 hypothetical protein GCM10007887_00980 [Methylobacterium haplocladii]